ncbi:MAG: c-type cytochrome domain-containing protein, partial [Planctomycetota bacterium]
MLTLASVLTLAIALGADESASRHFETKVRPLLASKCLSCHSAKAGKVKGGLDLSTAEGLAKGGASGPAVNARDPDGSLIMKAVRHLDDNLKMPPSGKLADDAIRELEQWIRLGAFYPHTPPSSKTEPLWSIAPLARPSV